MGRPSHAALLPRGALLEDLRQGGRHGGDGAQVSQDGGLPQQLRFRRAVRGAPTARGRPPSPLAPSPPTSAPPLSTPPVSPLASQVYRLHKDEPGFNLRATDLRPPPPNANLDDLTRGATFCLCPSGTGWGMRAFHAVALGCIPVIIQDDGSGSYPSVLQAFEGPLLDWASLAVRLTFADIPRLPSLLRALAADHEALAAKRRALVAALPRLLWREALATEERRALDAMPDAFDSVMEVLAGRRNATR